MAQNLLTDNQADVETDTTGFGGEAGAAISQDIVESKHGVASLKIITPNVAVSEGFSTTVTSVDASGTYTVSAWVKGTGTVQILIFERDAGDAFIGSTPDGAITLSSAWQRTFATRSFGATGVKAQVVVRTDVQQGITFYADALQLEQGSIVTPWRLPSGWGRRNAGRDLVVL